TLSWCPGCRRPKHGDRWLHSAERAREVTSCEAQLIILAPTEVHHTLCNSVHSLRFEMDRRKFSTILLLKMRGPSLSFEAGRGGDDDINWKFNTHPPS